MFRGTFGGCVLLECFFVSVAWIMATPLSEAGGEGEGKVGGGRR